MGSSRKSESDPPLKHLKKLARAFVAQHVWVRINTACGPPGLLASGACGSSRRWVIVWAGPGGRRGSGEAPGLAAGQGLIEELAKVR